MVFEADMTGFPGEVGSGNFGAIEIIFDVKREGEGGSARI